MKTKFRILMVIFLLAGTGLSAQIASDDAVYNYDIEEMTDLIQTSLENSTEKNEYVKMVLDYPDFPESKNYGSNKFRKELKEWVKSHPNQIEKLLIARKKNYDKWNSNELNN